MPEVYNHELSILGMIYESKYWQPPSDHTGFNVDKSVYIVIYISVKQGTTYKQ